MDNKDQVEYTGNGTAGREADVQPTGFFFQMPQREWQGLTDEEIDVLVMDSDGLPKSHLEFARAIEAKLKEKNG
jgi:hypothetical protein